MSHSISDRQSAVSNPVDVGSVLNAAPWGPYQQWLVFLTAITVVFDGIDNQLLGIVIPTLMREWTVPRGAFAPLVSLGYLGMMTGGALAGIAGDRFGRRTALLASMTVFGAMTLAAASAGSPTALGWLRLLAGIGLGGAIPNAAAMRFAASAISEGASSARATRRRNLATRRSCQANVSRRRTLS